MRYQLLSVTMRYRLFSVTVGYWLLRVTMHYRLHEATMRDRLLRVTMYDHSGRAGFIGGRWGQWPNKHFLTIGIKCQWWENDCWTWSKGLFCGGAACSIHGGLLKLGGPPLAKKYPRAPLVLNPGPTTSYLGLLCTICYLGILCATGYLGLQYTSIYWGLSTIGNLGLRWTSSYWG